MVISTGSESTWRILEQILLAQDEKRADAQTHTQPRNKFYKSFLTHNFFKMATSDQLQQMMSKIESMQKLVAATYAKNNSGSFDTSLWIEAAKACGINEFVNKDHPCYQKVLEKFREMRPPSDFDSETWGEALQMITGSEELIKKDHPYYPAVLAKFRELRELKKAHENK